jgi:hypothetical protein
MQVLPPAGGWYKVLEAFETDHVDRMRENPNRFIVLIIDFDGHEDRLTKANEKIPNELAERVFVLGSFSDPEGLKRDLGGTFESIGTELAKDCSEETNETWGHTLLRHNTVELDRLRQHVRPILFS